MNEIKENLKKEYDGKNISDKTCTEILECIEKAVHPKYHHLLTACRPVKTNIEIDVAILNALVKKEFSHNGKSKIEIYKDQLDLALTWNRVDIAKKYIFTEELKKQVNLLEYIIDLIKFLFWVKII